MARRNQAALYSEQTGDRQRCAAKPDESVADHDTFAKLLFTLSFVVALRFIMKGCYIFPAR
jgi:hypothetical protein